MSTTEDELRSLHFEIVMNRGCKGNSELTFVNVKLARNEFVRAYNGLQCGMVLNHLGKEPPNMPLEDFLRLR